VTLMRLARRRRERASGAICDEIRVAEGGQAALHGVLFVRFCLMAFATN
jgi:hypothetical protein